MHITHEMLVPSQNKTKQGRIKGEKLLWVKFETYTQNPGFWVSKKNLGIGHDPTKIAGPFVKLVDYNSYSTVLSNKFLSAMQISSLFQNLLSHMSKFFFLLDSEFR